MSGGGQTSDPLSVLAAGVLAAARAHSDLIATAESCTGGLVSAALTSVPGSSDVFDRGFVTYTNTAKSEMLGVPFWMIEKHGAVSEEVARSMAGGALTHSNATLAVAVTGIAGPGGGSVDKPVASFTSRPDAATCRCGINAWRLAISAVRRCAGAAWNARF